MVYPIRSLLPVFKPRLKGVVGGGRWEGIEAVASELPAGWCSGWFELPLSSGEPRVDFAVGAWREAGGREDLRTVLATGGESPSADSVRPVLRQWLRPGSLLDRQVDAIWLEYDLAGVQAAMPFVLFTPIRPAGAGDGLSPVALCSLLASVLQLLPGRPAAADPLAAMERCAAALPAGGRVIHFTVLPPWRSRQDLRLNVTVPARSVQRWLREIGWPGDGRQWEVVRDLLGSGWGHFQINVDFGSTVRSELSLEFALATAEQWSPLIRRLVDRGLCAAAKAQAALAWIGEQTTLPPAAESRVRIQRRLVIKLVVDRDGTPAAKGYLCFQWGYVLF